MQLNLIDSEGKLQDKNVIEEFLLKQNPQQKDMAVLSIFGSQSSGKSTLLNDIFSSSFQTLAQGLSKKRTTKGVDIQLKEVVSEKVVLCIDNEGTDSIERAYSNEKQIEQSIGTLSCAISQIIIMNQWFNELSRNAANSYPVIENMFQIYLTQLKDKYDDKKIVIYFVIRDSELEDESQKEEAIKMIQNNIMKIFDHVSNGVSFDHYFILKFQFLSHRIYKRATYDQEIAQLRKDIVELLDFQRPDYDVFCKLIVQLWDLICQNEEINIYKLKEYLIEQKIEQNIQSVSGRFQELLENNLNQLENLMQNTFTQMPKNSSLTKFLTSIEENFPLAKIMKYIQSNQLNNIINKFLAEDDIVQQLQVQLKNKMQFYSVLSIQYQNYVSKVLKIVYNLCTNIYIQMLNDLKEKFTYITPNVQLFGRNEQIVITINLLFKYVNHLLSYKQDKLQLLICDKIELLANQSDTLHKHQQIISKQLKHLATVPILMNVQEININIQSLTITLSEIAESLFVFQYYFIQNYLTISSNTKQELELYENIINFIKIVNQEYQQAIEFFQDKIVKLNQDQVYKQIKDMITDLSFNELTNQKVFKQNTQQISREAQQLLENMLVNILNYKFSIHSDSYQNYLFTVTETTQYYDIEELLRQEYKYCDSTIYLDSSKSAQLNMTQSITMNDSRIQLLESDNMVKINDIQYISGVDEVANLKNYIDKTINKQLIKYYKNLSAQRLESYGYQIYSEQYNKLKEAHKNVSSNQLKEVQSATIKAVTQQLDDIQKTEAKGLSLDQRTILLNQINILFNKQIKSLSHETQVAIPYWVWIVIVIAGRKDILIIFRNKILLTLMLIFGGFMYYLHKTKDLKELIQIINNSGIIDSIKSRDIQQVSENTKQLTEQVKQWLK